MSRAAGYRQRHCRYENNAQLDYWSPPPADRSPQLYCSGCARGLLGIEGDDALAVAEQACLIYRDTAEYRLGLSPARSGVASPDRW